MKEVIIFELNGKKPVKEWLFSFKDIKTKTRILERIKRLESGNLGDYKKIDSELSELRLKFGSGYRVYFMNQGKQLSYCSVAVINQLRAKILQKPKNTYKYGKVNNNEYKKKI